ncbi:flagellar motor switch phosphatase FliY [Ferroacidibacillus organovorans]|uniref:Flagellar motor switch phosphatase FliY n=1 Tax=Ferroacidibacillus organovorans TaxID=1765683 RepID=A0A162UXA5_9BACL|nr:flagellar motor switch phosphatase FliY [Ferroacidibacillus organovorans]KYP82113.1 hypothetical protein AYJ22_00175 [Ferroacidibacillus organovorans]OAG94448.1 hypothetical protein AYW79_05375 [Ferroacidibacillus organovorans]OPG15668.1 hypothetical protein B2M26_11480 [Ferroacidibacillus organovorans]
MSSDFLSQDEIDALLRGESAKGEDTEHVETLSEMECDAIGEIGNIAFGTAATTLSMLLRHKVNITAPRVSVIQPNDISMDMSIPHIAARVDYTEGLTGSNVLAIKQTDAQIIADLMLGGDGSNPSPEVSEMHLSAVAEAMNQMMGSAATSMSTMLMRTVNISTPHVKTITSLDTDSNEYLPQGNFLVRILFRLQVGELIDSNIIQILSMEFAHELVATLMAQSYGTYEPQAPITSPEPILATPSAAARSAYAQTAQATQPIAPSVPRGGAPIPEFDTESAIETVHPDRVERAVFAPLDERPYGEGIKNLDLLMDVPLEVTVELGRAKKLLRDVLDMSIGSVLELETLAGEPVDILVNRKRIARGEVVVIDEHFGVRVTDILSPAERVKRLQ